MFTELFMNTVATLVWQVALILVIYLCLLALAVFSAGTVSAADEAGFLSQLQSDNGASARGADMLTLTDAVERALDGHPQLSAMSSERDAAEGLLRSG